MYQAAGDGDSHGPRPGPFSSEVRSWQPEAKVGGDHWHGLRGGSLPRLVSQEGFLEEGRVNLASVDEPSPPDRAWLRGRSKPGPFPPAPETARC